MTIEAILAGSNFYRINYLENGFEIEPTPENNLKFQEIAREAIKIKTNDYWIKPHPTLKNKYTEIDLVLFLKKESSY